MARKSTSKVSKKVDLDLNINKPSKRTTRKVKTKLKKLSFGVVMLAIFLLAVGVVGGYFGVLYLSRNDCFNIVGAEEITLEIGESYLDEGVRVIAFGVDETDKVEIETNLKKNNDGKFYAQTEGTYYIKYTVNNIKYGSIFKVQKIRLIHFVEPTESEELGGANA